MSLFQQITGVWRGKIRAEDLARQLARLHWVKVWERLSEQVWQMSRNERRGYIRARGALAIQQAVEQAIRQRQIRHISLAHLYAITMDQVVLHVADHMASCLPQVHRGHRAA